MQNENIISSAEWLFLQQTFGFHVLLYVIAKEPSAVLQPCPSILYHCQGTLLISFIFARTAPGMS